jgi:hypothetical protein
MARNPVPQRSRGLPLPAADGGYFALIVAAAAIETLARPGRLRRSDAAAIGFWRGRARTAGDEGVVPQVGQRGRAPDPRDRERDRRRRELLTILRTQVRASPSGSSSSARPSTRTFGTGPRRGRRSSRRQERLEAGLAQLRRDGVQAEGTVGDGDPLQAIEDAMRTFGADEIVISTHPSARTGSSATSSATHETASTSITHVVIDLDA